MLDDGKSQWVIGVGDGVEADMIGEFRITARAFWIAAERIVLTQATEFSVKNIPILKTPEPVTVELDLARGQARFAGPGTELQTPIAQFREQVRSSLAAMKRAAEAFASKRGAERKVLPAKFKWSVEFKPAPSRLSNIDLDQDGTDEILALSGKTI
ncbi:MAG: hypothetical protein QF886_01335, partial [Planctomycetota bacterium]|nr:hypothetical protein [Planctomycetota bacterium]